jgi:hypothetical protein
VEWVKGLTGKTVGLDTAPLIYFIEENPTYLEAVRLFFENMECRTKAGQPTWNGTPWKSSRYT